MNREAMEKWADGLQFGDYPQIRGALRNFEGCKEAFCAMGVACKEYAKQHDLGPTSVAYEDLFDPYENVDSEVLEWLGIDNTLAIEIIHKNDHQLLSLPQIGIWIRDNLLKEQ